MKKFSIIIVSVLITCCLILLINSNYYEGKIITDSKTQNILNTNSLTMMYETDYQSGEYQVSSDTTWPQDGYIFNERLSKCENGGVLSWDNENKKVLLQTNTSDKCFVYFDKEPDIIYLADYIINNVYTGTDGDNGLYYHDGEGTYTNADQEAGDNSYRYSGTNPNNYVCFGSTENSCPEENLYRIIGAFDDDNDTNYQIKLIKADYTTSAMLGTDGRDYYGTYSSSTSNYNGSMDTSIIATYRWNYDTSVTEWGSNNWKTSEFNTINLNTNYWNYLGATWQNLIAETTWYLGGHSTQNATAEAFYGYERGTTVHSGRPTSTNAYIGLMYPSDYGYAASPDARATNLNGYDSSTITSNNWLYLGLDEWTITSYSSYSYSGFYVNYNGALDGNTADIGYSARPVFYLESNVQLEGGSGTTSDPYRIN